ncbi:MAG: MATE family efflux transporter [Eubacteriales bacterium]|nr:MATE family efflux transporter [Eubacteriales bacterium]
MNHNESLQNPLATEPIGKLIGKYSIPTALTLMVNYLYNIVDQVFIGQGVGVTGMAATNVSFPLTIIAIAIALLVGDGCAANVSLYLGRKQQELADQTVSHAVTLLIGSGIALALLCSLFAPSLVSLLGATETSFQESLSYTHIIIWGLPFLMLSSSLTAIIRADGNPQYTMKCMMVGAAVNLVLDPIFIFIFHMGIIGAGIATVIGEMAAGLLCLRYVRHLKHIHIQKRFLLPTRPLALRILALGFPSLITQLLTAAVQIVMNNLMARYGAQSIYGSDTALSVYGMMMKIYQIAHSMFVGVSSATQPINGYNFGAKNYTRVYRTYRLAAAIAMAISVGWFFVYQIFSRQIGMLFVSGNTVYLDCCQHIFRFYMGAFFLYGIHMSTASFFQSIGQPGKALCIPVVRQAIVLIPLSILLSSKFGLDGALMAAPISDILVFVLSIALVAMEFRQWKHRQWISKP